MATVVLGALTYVALLLLYPNVSWFDRGWAAVMVGIVVGVPAVQIGTTVRSDASLKVIAGWALLGVSALSILGWMAISCFRGQERALLTVRGIGSQHIVRIVVKCEGGMYSEERRPKRLESMARALRRAYIYGAGHRGTIDRIEISVYTDRGFHYLTARLEEGLPRDAIVRFPIDSVDIMLPQFMSLFD